MTDVTEDGTIMRGVEKEIERLRGRLRSGSVTLSDAIDGLAALCIDLREACALADEALCKAEAYEARLDRNGSLQ
jgi:hypothetical protein